MGPEESDKTRKLLEAPELNSHSDKFQYRKDVRMWVRRIRSFANGGDTKAKGILNGLGYALYASMEESYQRIVDAGMESGEVSLDNENGEALTPDKYNKVVEDIIKIVAQDSPTESVRRLVRMSRDIFSCRRKPNEEFQVYAERFRGLAQTYLNNCHSASGQVDSQNFAMILLENANLPESTFNNIVSILIAKAERTSQRVVPQFFVSQDELDQLIASNEVIMEKIAQNSDARGSNLPDAIKIEWPNIDKFCKLMSAKCKRICSEDRMGVTISMQDAVEALRNIKCSNGDTKDATFIPENAPWAPKKIGTMITGYERQKGEKRGYIQPELGVHESRCDPNPIYDPGAPFSVGGVDNAAALCDALGIKLELLPPRNNYLHGWGDKCHEASPIIALWELTTFDRNAHPTSLCFDIVNTDTPLIVGLDVAEFANQNNLSRPTFISFKRPFDNKERTFNTYISKKDNADLCKRLRIEIAPHETTNISTLMSASLRSNASRQPRVFAKKIHRYTHATPEQIHDICEQAGVLTPKLQEAIHEVDRACEICACTGRPKPSKKISLSHINEQFNREIQIDFMYAQARGAQHIVLLITDVGTAYAGGCVVINRSLDNIISKIEELWILQHGAPVALSADDEYHRKKLLRYLSSHDISFKARPTRRHNKTGIVERKIQTVKMILARLDKEKTDCLAETIIKRAIFLSNMFSGSRTLSSFQLVRGYQPSVLGIPASVVSQELLDSHKEQMATRALQKVLKSHNPTICRADMFSPGDPIWVWYSSTKNEANEWVRAQVEQAHENYIEARRVSDGILATGPPMRPAYEDVRPAPRSALTRELMACTLEDELSTSVNEGENVDNVNNEEYSPRDNPHDDNTVQNVNTLMTGRVVERNEEPEKQEENKDGPFHGIVLTSEKQKVLDIIHNQVGTQQVTRKKLEFAPSWVVDEAFKKEFESNWAEAFESVLDVETPRNANIISSHVVYKVKVDEEGEMKLKARIVPHGNRDSEKDNIRKDSATAQLGVIRLLLSLTTFLNFVIATADIAGAYLQSGPIKRSIFVRPPNEWRSIYNTGRGILWRLVKLPYGIVEAGRQWMLTVEEWMMSEYGLERVHGVGQMFIKRNISKRITLIIAKVSDDFLIAGKRDAIEHFLNSLKKRFEVGKITYGPKLLFNGCEIILSDAGDIKISMERYWRRVQAIPLSRARRKQQDCNATGQEITMYRSLAGTLLYLGNGVLPQASLVVSIMQQRLPYLSVRNIVDANKMINELKLLNPTLVYRKVSDATNVVMCSFSDAAHPKDRDYGQTGILTGLLMRNACKGNDVFHLTDWISQKQRRVSHSAYGAEVLAATAADDMGFYYKHAIKSIFPGCEIKHELNVDSRGLWDTIATVHEGKDLRLRQTVQRIRNSFESKDLNVIRWISGPHNYADALKKRNFTLFKKLNYVCISGLLDLKLDAGSAVDKDN